MIDELDFETYLSISSKKIGIYLLDKRELKNLYFKEQNFEIENAFMTTIHAFTSDQRILDNSHILPSRAKAKTP